MIQQEYCAVMIWSMSCCFCRHTGMRIGECVDLSLDCWRPLGPDQWAIHVPLGKLKTERWVPVDAVVCQLVEPIRSRRPPAASQAGRSCRLGLAIATC